MGRKRIGKLLLRAAETEEGLEMIRKEIASKNLGFDEVVIDAMAKIKRAKYNEHPIEAGRVFLIATEMSIKDATAAAERIAAEYGEDQNVC